MSLVPTSIPLSALTDPFGKNRRTIRSEPNPLDKTTIFSIFPKYVKESKHTLQPSEYILEPGTYEKPSALTVGTASWWRDVDPDQPLLEIPVSSIQVADSVVTDYMNGYLGCDMGEKRPGLFYIPGDIPVKKLVTEHKTVLDRAKTRQDNWYREIIKVGDILWARTNGNPLVIWDDMRLAAKELGLEREWNREFQPVELIKCIACGNMRNPNFPICATCKYIDPNHPLSKELKFAV